MAALVREHGAAAIVVGLPRNMDGTIGPQAEKVQAFADALKPVVRVPVRFWDERLTTVEAEQILIERRRVRGSAARAWWTRSRPC